MTVEIVILAMIAAFLGLRLYSVLGRRAEHEEEPIAGRFEGPPATGAVGRSPPRVGADQAATDKSAQVLTLPAATPGVERGLREIAAADRRFDANAFVEGARGAYQMILEAFWRGDKDELRQFCDDEVYQSFADAIDARGAVGETLDNRLIRIEESTIVEAEYQAPLARLAVRFRTDIAAVTRDSGGLVVGGSLDDAVEAIDIWTFGRNVRSDDPDWTLEATDEG